MSTSCKFNEQWIILQVDSWRVTNCKEMDTTLIVGFLWNFLKFNIKYDSQTGQNARNLFDQTFCTFAISNSAESEIDGWSPWHENGGFPDKSKTMEQEGSEIHLEILQIWRSYKNFWRSPSTSKVCFGYPFNSDHLQVLTILRLSHIYFSHSEREVKAFQTREMWSESGFFRRRVE